MSIELNRIYNEDCLVGMKRVPSGRIMNANEIVMALRCCNRSKGHRCSECPVFSRYEHRICKATVDRFAADLIETLQAQLAERDEKIERHKDWCKNKNETIIRLSNEAHKANVENKRLRDAQRWIPVDERLPEDGSNKVLVYIPQDNDKQHGCFLADLKPVRADETGRGNFFGIPTPGSIWTVWGFSYFEEPHVTHWMPLPAAPEEGGSKWKD